MQRELNIRDINSSSQWPNNVGILAMEIYFPNIFVDQKDLEKFKGVSEGKYTIGLERNRMSFCTGREDLALFV